MQDLQFWFRKARLNIRIVNVYKRISGINNPNVFSMTIDRTKKKEREFFRIYRGHEDNQVNVIDVNKKYDQIILQVSEPEREFEIKTWSYARRRTKTVIMKTPDYSRKFLMGKDETHYFIAQLPNNVGIINKVGDAHRILKPKPVQVMEKNKYRIKRQGEWFFLPVSNREMEKIEKYKNFIEYNIPLGSRWLSRRSHIADQYLENIGEVFVKGKIKHMDHKTLKLHGWFKVLLNAEARSTQGYSPNVIWWD